MCKQRLTATEFFFEPAMALLGISAVAGEMALRHRIGDQCQFATDDEWLLNGMVFIESAKNWDIILRIIQHHTPFATQQIKRVTAELVFLVYVY